MLNIVYKITFIMQALQVIGERMIEGTSLQPFPEKYSDWKVVHYV